MTGDFPVAIPSPSARSHGAAPAPAEARPLRVLYYVAYPERMAGANRSLFELVTNLPPEVDPLVVVAGGGRVMDAFLAAGVECRIEEQPGAMAAYGGEVMRSSALRKARIAAADLVPYVRRLRRLMIDERIDLVHLNDVRGAITAAPAARLAGVPVVAHLRGELPFGALGRRIFELAGHRIVTVSEGVRETLSPLGRRRAVTVYNGTRDLDAAGAGPRPLPWLASLREQGVAVACCFASIVPFKGHHHLIRAAALLDQRGLGDRISFVCVGDLMEEHADYHGWLRELFAETGVRNVTFTGWTDDPFSFYRHADLTVLPSVTQESLTYGGRERSVMGNEGLPRTHLEAMSFALPVVGTRIAGVPEQIEDGATGRVVPPGDPVALADALEELVRDPDGRREMGRRGRERVMRLFSTDAYVRGVLRVYDELLAGRSLRATVR